MNVETIKEICRRELAAFPAVQVCILYGSFAHGTAGVHSDIDLGICGQAVLSPEVVNTITTVLSTALGHETDVLYQERIGSDFTENSQQWDTAFCKG